MTLLQHFKLLSVTVQSRLNIYLEDFNRATYGSLTSRRSELAFTLSFGVVGDPKSDLSSAICFFV